ncbi:SDR family NAD(P)-dependent oxidoreductase [Dactylosporangium sp. NPDC000555]|uniref:SDR family NAD(P)-dependent oxidoreductase n=1 Tax=Dactylosporangium sp. NPDC000555 TaxID=3154260 RepID=UPI003324FC39
MDDSSTRLDGLVAVVTGAGRGLGRAEALALADGGARVVVNDFDADAAEAVVAAIAAAGGEAVAGPGDVADFAFAKGLVETAVERFGRLDVLVNNAGILRDRMLFGMSEEEWDAVLRVHLRGHFATSRWATAHWRERSKRSGGPVYARVVNTASESALIGAPGQANYASAKAGIIALTLATARGCAAYGVRANAICPRANTRMTAAGDDTVADDPFGADKVAPLVAYLASPAADRLSGQVFVAYAGMVALLAAPQVDRRFDAPGGTWTPEGLAAELGPVFAKREPVTDGFMAASVRALDGGAWAGRAR